MVVLNHVSTKALFTKMAITSQSSSLSVTLRDNEYIPEPTDRVNVKAMEQCQNQNYTRKKLFVCLYFILIQLVKKDRYQEMYIKSILNFCVYCFQRHLKRSHPFVTFVQEDIHHQLQSVNILYSNNLYLNVFSVFIHSQIMLYKDRFKAELVLFLVPITCTK